MKNCLHYYIKYHVVVNSRYDMNVRIFRIRNMHSVLFTADEHQNFHNCMKEKKSFTLNAKHSAHQ